MVVDRWDKISEIWHIKLLLLLLLLHHLSSFIEIGKSCDKLRQTQKKWLQSAEWCAKYNNHVQEIIPQILGTGFVDHTFSIINHSFIHSFIKGELNPENKMA